jgi:hypothetical protein
MTRSLRWLKDDIALRMMQKLELLKHEPRSLLIIPDAPGIHAFQKQHSQAFLIQISAGPIRQK